MPVTSGAVSVAVVGSRDVLVRQARREGGAAFGERSHNGHDLPRDGDVDLAAAQVAALVHQVVLVAQVGARNDCQLAVLDDLVKHHHLVHTVARAVILHRHEDKQLLGVPAEHAAQVRVHLHHHVRLLVAGRQLVHPLHTFDGRAYLRRRGVEAVGEHGAQRHHRQRGARESEQRVGAHQRGVHRADPSADGNPRRPAPLASALARPAPTPPPRLLTVLAVAPPAAAACLHLLLDSLLPRASPFEGALSPLAVRSSRAGQKAPIAAGGRMGNTASRFCSEGVLLLGVGENA
mmetsp:Transcript_45583/g.116608  ORF Transcript_45583/g.116608 Transcript_45583/m.116608 type:complete len:291 (-) Transcript_45583:151-1023(-)